MKIAILDDYQNIAMKIADWSSLSEKHDIDVFNDHLSEFELLVQRLYPYDIICVMRERTPFTAQLIKRLPNLKMIASTGFANASIDQRATQARGIQVMNTGYESTPTIEATLALIFAVARHIPQENASVRAGGWQVDLGSDLKDKTLSILGLGNIGSGVAKIGLALGMRVIAWSTHLTKEHAEQLGVIYVSREQLFRQADFLSVHLVLSERTMKFIGSTDLALMKSTAYIINTSRGAIFDEPALIQALKNRKIGGAALDTFATEPLPLDHPFRQLSNVIATPHIGFVTERLYRIFFEDTISNIQKWLIENEKRVR